MIISSYFPREESDKTPQKHSDTTAVVIVHVFMGVIFLTYDSLYFYNWRPKNNLTSFYVVE